MNKIVNLLNRVLSDKGLKLKKQDEYMYWSPFVTHHKRKLQINIKNQKLVLLTRKAEILKKINEFKPFGLPIRDLVDLTTSAQAASVSRFAYGDTRVMQRKWKCFQTPGYLRRC